MPTGFTPNNDGVNDIFKANGIDVKDFSLMVFNRWGEKIFQTQDIDIGWDGTYKGTPAPFGMYIWILEASDKFGNPFLNETQSRGTVSLVR